MSDHQKAPWKKLAGTDSKQYAANKPTMIKAKPSVANAKPKAKTSAAKPKAMKKVTTVKAGKMRVKLTKCKVAGTKKSPKTIKRIKITKTAKTVKKIKPSKSFKTTRKIKVRSFYFSFVCLPLWWINAIMKIHCILLLRTAAQIRLYLKWSEQLMRHWKTPNRSCEVQSF